MPTRNAVITKIVSELESFEQRGMVIFHFNGENRFYHSTHPFPADSPKPTF